MKKQINKKVLHLLLVSILVLCSMLFSFAQNSGYGYESWLEKDKSAKDNMQIPAEFIKTHGMKLVTGSSGHEFYFVIPGDRSDSLKMGRVQVGVFQSSMKAQLRLLSFLDELASPVKPIQLSKKDLLNVDIAFGNINDEIAFIVFTKNNVFAIIQSTTEKAKEIAQMLANNIDKAPHWNEGDYRPSFKLENN